MKILIIKPDFYKKIITSRKYILILITVLILGYSTKSALAQTSPSTLYVPLIGITSVPDPLTLSNGPGNVTYNYAVKNFLNELPLSDVQINDDTCSPVKFVTGDDNNDKKLGANETWRYTCTIKLSVTTQSIATVKATANAITATHKAYATVVVGSNVPPPLVSIINISKLAYPLSLPSEGGKITFTYKVNNPGIIPLSDVVVTDDKCSAISSKLGDTNGNNLLDINEVWIYTCSTILKQTTTNTASVTAFANGLKAYGDNAITVKVNTSPPIAQAAPKFPEAGDKPDATINPYIKITVWAALSVILAALIIFFAISRKSKVATTKSKNKTFRN